MLRILKETTTEDSSMVMIKGLRAEGEKLTSHTQTRIHIPKDLRQLPMTATPTPLPRDSACCLLPPLIRDLRKAPTVLGTLSASKSKAVSYKRVKLTLIYGTEIAIQSHSQVQESKLVLIKQPKITEISLVCQATPCFKPEEAADPLYYNIIFRTC